MTTEEYEKGKTLQFQYDVALRGVWLMAKRGLETGDYARLAEAVAECDAADERLEAHYNRSK